MSPSGYPEIDVEGAALQYERELEAPTEALPAPVLVGQGHLPNDDISLTEWCETGFDCNMAWDENRWRMGAEPIHFAEPGHTPSETEACAEEGTHTELSIPVVNESGETDTMYLHAQRVQRAGTNVRTTNLHDATPWFQRDNMTQALRVWIPYESNVHLGAGTWRNDGEYAIAVMQGSAEIDTAAVAVNLRVYEPTLLNLETDYTGPSYTAEGSSSYFVLTDETVGPTSGVWWGTSDPTPLRIAVKDDATGEENHLNVNAWKRSCDKGWGTWWNLNSAQVADGTCEQRMQLSAGDNSHLESGHTYRSSNARPVIVRAMGWHAGRELGRDAYSFEFIAP